jgi:iron(III) transport system substrate-binding protein
MIAACVVIAVGVAGSVIASAQVVVYCSVDEAVGRRVLDVYKTRTGVDVSVIYDSEAGKTTGLVQRIIRESQTGRPRADVFWSSELFNTILLARMGLLEPYESPQSVDIPSRFKDREHRWTAPAVRARVLAFDPRRTAESQLPTRWEELADGDFAKRSAIANPLFGTTRGHVAAMFALWGPDRAKAFLTRLRDGGVQVVDGNSATVRAVIAGRAAFAWTDTDDVFAARRSGASVEMRHLDMGGGGTLLIPCSVAIIHGGPNAAAARSLVDFLVSAEVERMLAQSEARFVPVREALRTELNVVWPPETVIDFNAVADAMDAADAAVREILIR